MNRLLFGPTSSVAATVARCIERASIDPRYLSSELTAHKAAFAEQGAHIGHMIDAELADIARMRLCGLRRGYARRCAEAEAVVGVVEALS